MNDEAKKEITRDAAALAYTHIRLSGLHKEIDNETWDRLADQWGKYIANLLDEFTNDEFTKIEGAKVPA